MNNVRTIYACLVALCFSGALQSQQLMSVDPLVFGRFVSPSSTASIVVEPSSNRTCYLITCLSTPTPQAASFVVSGEQGRLYSITIDESAYLSDGNSATMLVDEFVESNNGVGILGPDGSDQFNLGARLNVSPGQISGDYTGSFNVIINYQ